MAWPRRKVAKSGALALGTALALERVMTESTQRAALLAASILLMALVMSSCASDDGPGTVSDGADAGASADAGPPPDNMGVLPDPAPQSGVSYVAHWHTASSGDDKLMWYRTDGDAPRFEAEMNLGNPTQGMALDPVNDLLATVSDVGKTITLFKLSRPDSPASPVTAPVEVGQFEYGDGEIPVAVFFSPHQHRLFIAVSVLSDSPTTSYDIYAYKTNAADDVSDPSWLEPVAGWPRDLPPTIYHAVDSARGLLFLVGSTDHMLRGYSLSDEGFEPLPGEAIDMKALYPVPDGQSSQTGFQARNIKVDPWRQRVYVVRSQGILSEMMSFEYPGDVPRFGAKYGDFVSMSDLVPVKDAFDLDKTGDQRPNLLDGYDVDFDTATGSIFMSADAWNGTGSTAIVTNFKNGIAELAKGCDEFEGFGCFVRYVLNDAPIAYQRTDGSLCVDGTHGVVVATSIAQKETDPGSMHFYKYDSDLNMQRWIPEGGKSAKASSLPVAAVCH